MGTPAQKFKVQLDTSSADSWVPSTSCNDCGVWLRGRSALGSGVSQSLTEPKSGNESSWSADYSPSFPLPFDESPLGQVQGTKAQDLLVIDGGLSTENCPIGLATSVSDAFSAPEIPFLGVLGLANSHAYPQLSMQDSEPLIWALYENGKIPRPEIGIALGRSDEGHNSGQLAFGGIAPSRFDGEVTTMESLSKEGYWEVPLVAASGNVSLEERTGIIDTRSSVIWAPQEDVIDLFLEVPGACQCHMLALLAEPAH